MQPPHLTTPLLASRSRGELIVLLLVAAFPFLSVAVPSGGSVVYTLLALAGLWGGWAALSTPRRELKLWYLLLLGLFLLGAVSLAYSADLHNGVSRVERLLRLATLPLLIGVMVRYRVKAGMALLIGLSTGALALALQGFYEVVWLKHPIAEGLYHKIIFGDMSILTALLLFAAVVTLLPARSRWWAVVAISLALYASLMSGARGGWLVLPVAALVMVWLYRRRLAPRVWLAIGAATLLVVILLAVIRPAPLVKPIEKGVAELQLYASDPAKFSSWGARLNMWRNAALIWWDNPLLGTGIGDFNHDMQELVKQGRSLSADVLQFGHAHSVYFDTLATLGVIGLLLMVAALFILPGRYFYRAWQEGGSPPRRFAALAGLLTVIAFAVFGFSEGWLSRNPFINPYTFYLALFTASLLGEEQEASQG